MPLLTASIVAAQDLEPRSYSNIPVGETFLVLGLARSEGDLTPTSTSTLEDAELTIDAGVIGMAHTFSFLGDSAKFDMVAGRACYEGSAVFKGEFVEGRRCEYIDPKARFTWNFYGAEALKLEDFGQWDRGLVIGGSLQVTIPAGTYDSDNLINAGANRWMIRPGLGMSYRTGPWHFDLVGSARFFEDNDDFFGGNYVEQAPLYSLQGHVIYNLERGTWLSVNANFFRGGKTTQNGRHVDDLQENSRLGVTYSKPITRHHTVTLFYNTGVVTRVGNEFDTWGASWLYRF